jgi:toxin ParE1/3/4
LSLPVRRTVQAERDITRHFVDLAVDNMEVAERFVESVWSGSITIADFPQIGPNRTFRNPRLRGIRFWPVPDFPRYLMFYRVLDDFIQIVRVLHSSQDITEILENE